HPANLGRFCSKGAALADTIGPDDRLLHPEIRGVRASWHAALEHVARGFAAAVEAHGPDSVAFYVSGQLLTEDYYVANKLMKGFIGKIGRASCRERVEMWVEAAAVTRQKIER